MTQPSDSPPLGAEHPDTRDCTRLLGRNEDGSERLCGKPAALHIDWGEALGNLCQEHAEDALARGWKGIDVHDFGSSCGMPGSLWYTAVWEGVEHSWCAIPGDGSDVAEPVRAAQEIPTAVPAR